MSLLDDLKAKADANGDGKVDMADLQGLSSNAGGLFSSLKSKFFKK
jgi:hypothetical protein